MAGRAHAAEPHVDTAPRPLGALHLRRVQAPLLAVVAQPAPLAYVRPVRRSAVRHVGHLAGGLVDDADVAAVGGDEAEPLAGVVQPGPLAQVGAVGGGAVLGVEGLAGGDVDEAAGVVAQVFDAPLLVVAAVACPLLDIDAVGGRTPGYVKALAAVAFVMVYVVEVVDGSPDGPVIGRPTRRTGGGRGGRRRGGRGGSCACGSCGHSCSVLGFCPCGAFVLYLERRPSLRTGT